MTLSLSLHNTIEKYNVLEKPTNQLYEYFKTHPSLYKTALVANHLFRAVSMAAFALALPFSIPISAGICFAGSLFYRLTVETHCAYKFALPAFAGSIALPMGQTALADLISGVAFTSMSTFALALVSSLPLTAYFAYIALTVNHDVDSRR
ncbi:MAG: hypothetical protein KGZ39_05405 [Simkania sp.]|nr:hypothetical protein [Simkania sp.]